MTPEELAEDAACGKDDGQQGIAHPYCSGDHLMGTPADRRLLWYLQAQLEYSAPKSGKLREVALNLSQYLSDTCRHHRHDHDAEDGIPARRQCVWCYDIEWLDRRTAAGEGQP